ncbi:hypothetical protein BgiBS90_024914, partial [Biomphalaria glabrata]
TYTTVNYPLVSRATSVLREHVVITGLYLAFVVTCQHAGMMYPSRSPGVSGVTRAL